VAFRERFAEHSAVEVVGREAQEMPDGGSDVRVAGRPLIDEVRLEVGAGGDERVVHVEAAERGMVSLPRSSLRRRGAAAENLDNCRLQLHRQRRFARGRKRRPDAGSAMAL
jgi:hypothetical protein